MALPRSPQSHRSTLRVPPAVTRFAEAVITRAGIGKLAIAEQIIQALQVVPRDQFLEERFRPRALEDSRLPSGFGQFSPAPFLLARMMALGGIGPGVTVLELECGAGYASALMCVLGARVFATEKIGLRAQATRKHLDSMGLNRVLVATGHLAWADSAPFDTIIAHTPFASDADIERFIPLLDPTRGRIIAPAEQPVSAQILLVEMTRNGPRRSLI